MKHITASFVSGAAAILTADGKIDLDHFRPLARGEKYIRVPRLEKPSAAPDEQEQLAEAARFLAGDFNIDSRTRRWQIAIRSGDALFDELPIGTKLVFAIFGLGDIRSPERDGRTVVFHDIPLNTPMEFSSSDDVVAAADGFSLQVYPPWESVTLTKTGSNRWTASGDLVSKGY